MSDEKWDVITILHNSKNPNPDDPSPRTWNLSVQFNGQPSTANPIDIAPLEEYQQTFKEYIKRCADAVWAKKDNPSTTVVNNRLMLLHGAVVEYRDFLLDTLQLRSVEMLRERLKSCRGCKILILEEDENYEPGYGHTEQPLPSIHRVHWELLEHASLPPEMNRAEYQFQICRIKTFFKVQQSHRSLTGSMQRRSTTTNKPREPDLLRVAREPLTKILNQPSQTVKILLVLARRLGPKPTSLSNSLNVEEDGETKVLEVVEDDLDTLPHLAQLPLMKIQKEMEDEPKGHRLLLDIVRPGSLMELVNHIESRQKQKPSVQFNIIHFDLHGKIARDK